MSFTNRHYDEVARIIRGRREYVASLNAAARNAESAPIPNAVNIAAHKNYADGYDSAVTEVQGSLSRMFAGDNPRFDPERFAMACEPKEAQR